MSPELEVLVKHVTSAIETRQNIGVVYQGKNRLVTPHLLAETNRGRILLHGFQFGGETSRGPVTDPSEGEWRYLYLDEFEALSVGPGPEYPASIEKAIKETYRPPAFVVAVFAIRERP